MEGLKRGHATSTTSGRQAGPIDGVSDAQLASLTEEIIRVANPRRVVLFGSQARGTANRDSDVDLLIIGDRSTEEGWSRRREIGRIRRSLPSIGAPIDILFFTPAEIEKWRHTTNHVIVEALREGKVLYERP
jgi:predicted nucleotidyltransferase